MVGCANECLSISTRYSFMGELDTYSLIDFMPMESEIYFRLFVRVNETVWPVQWLTLIAGAAAIWLAWLGRGRYAGVIFGICWAWVGLIFHIRLFAELNWAASYLGWAFIGYGLLLLVAGFLGWLDHAPEPTWVIHYQPSVPRGHEHRALVR